MKSHIVIVVISICIAIALSLVFIPDEKEIALMNYKVHNYDTAKQIYAQLIEAGDWAVSSVMPMIQIHSHSGDILAAIEVLERFIELNPDHLDALTLIGTLYKDAQLPSKYRYNLEKLMQLAPNEQRLRELSSIYAYTAQTDKRINVLRELIEHYDYSSKDLFELTYLLARHGQHSEAVQLLFRANMEDSSKLDMKARKTLISLLLKLEDKTDVINVIKEWIEVSGSVEEDTAYYGEWLLSNGYAKHAFRLLKWLDDSSGMTDSTRQLFMVAALETGHKYVAHNNLKSWSEEGQLNKALLSILIEQMLAVNDFEGALEEVQRWLTLGNFPDSSLFGLIMYAYRHDKLASLDNMLAAIDQTLMKDRPIVMIQSALARNEQESALHEIQRAEQHIDLSHGEQVVLIHQLTRLNQIDHVLTNLRNLVRSSQLPAEECRDLTRIYIDIKHTREGLNQFETIRKIRPSVEIQACWALLAAAEGQEDAVLSWLRDHSPTDGTALRDLYMIARSNGLHRLAFAAAQRLSHLRPTKQHEHFTALALLELNRVEEALSILESLVPADGAVEATYLKALKAANKVEKLISYGMARLDSQKIDERNESLIIRALLDAKAYEEVLPHLRRVAHQKSAIWAFDYLGVLRQLDRNTELQDYMRDRLGQEGLTTEERRQLAFDLLELGDKKTAVSIFEQLASGASIESPDVQQLLYLWGPYPGNQALDWIEHRALKAPPLDQVSWFQHLVHLGGADRVVRHLESSVNGIQSFMAPVYAEALAAKDRWPELAQYISKSLANVQDSKILKRYAELVVKTKDARVIEDVWRVILANNPDDKEALRELGLILYRNNQFTDAERYLSKYKARQREDYEIDYIYGQVMLNLHNHREAIANFQEVLSQLQRLSKRHYQDRKIEAMTLSHLGKVEQSIAVFEHLLQQRPTDLNLRADFASMLIDNGLHEKAKQIIGQH